LEIVQERSDGVGAAQVRRRRRRRSSSSFKNDAESSE